MESVNGRALGLGCSSLDRRKHTLASYLMGQMQWAGSVAQGHGPPPVWSCTSAALQGAGWHMLRASAEELQ